MPDFHVNEVVLVDIPSDVRAKEPYLQALFFGRILSFDPEENNPQNLPTVIVDSGAGWYRVRKEWLGKVPEGIPVTVLVQTHNPPRIYPVTLRAHPNTLLGMMGPIESTPIPVGRMPIAVDLYKAAAKKVLDVVTIPASRPGAFVVQIMFDSSESAHEFANAILKVEHP